MFPDGKLKPLPPLIPGSRREQFRERAEGSAHQGEVTTLERDGAVYFLVLNASPATLPQAQRRVRRVGEESLRRSELRSQPGLDEPRRAERRNEHRRQKGNRGLSVSRKPPV